MEIFESLLQGLREVCTGFSDARRGTDLDYTMADIGLSAFSLFFMQSESFLAHQRRLEQGHGSS
ncbi:MAG: ISNCY family transposase, partial [Acidobacteriaceae bacterium]